MWQVIKQIAKGTSFYYKQLNLFLALGVLVSVAIGANYWLQQNPKNNYGADASVVGDNFRSKDDQIVTDYDIRISPKGAITVNGKTQKGLLKFGQDRDEFLFIAVRELDTSLDSVRVTVRLPYEVDNVETILPRIYAIHGVNNSRYKQLDNKTVEFSAEGIAPGAEVSVGFSFPKNYFALSSADRVRSDLQVLSSAQWLVIGISLPLVTVLFLLYMMLKRALAQMRVRNKMPVNIIPSDVPPAIIGALYRGYIGKKEITATLFDLARRGFISVYLGEDDEIIFAKGGSLYGPKANLLRPYEIFLLHQIFGEQEFASGSKQITLGLNSELFSSKIALTILNIYDATIAEGYFIKSPNAYFMRYRMVGLFLFFIALVAVVYGAFTLPEPAYILFMWAGMLVTSLLIIKMTPGLPTRTRLGDKTLRQWMAFRNYLSSPQLIEATNTQDFFNNLPYAIVLDCEKQWIARWREQAIRLPEWFSAEQDLYTAEEFSKSVVTIIDFLAKHLIASRPPDLA